MPLSLKEEAKKNRRCWAEVPRGGLNEAHPGRCMKPGVEKVNGTWRCRLHLPESGLPLDEVKHVAA